MRATRSNKGHIDDASPFLMGEIGAMQRRKMLHVDEASRVDFILLVGLLR
jgi:hypothetical protein